jgi:hypothetical protein
MDKRTERTPPPPQPKRGSKRKYEPPEILSQQVFETTALACSKRPGSGGACSFGMMKNS